MDISFINVGYGDAILIQEQGKTILVDGGSSLPEEFESGVDRIPAIDYLKESKIEQIDTLIISHIHEDHVCGLEAVVNELDIGEIYLPFDPELFNEKKDLVPDPEAPRSVHLFTKALNTMVHLGILAKEKRISIKKLAQGDYLTAASDLNIRVLAPEPEVQEKFANMLKAVYEAGNPTELLTEMDRTSNHTSLLLSVESGGMGCLLAGDICPHTWGRIDFSLLKNENVLKLPHHGQKDCFSEELYSMMPLQAVITTASSDRRYNSANPEVYEGFRRIHPDAQLLFIDEREYLPYFSNPEGAQAIHLKMNSGEVRTEFIKIKKKRRIHV